MVSFVFLSRQNEAHSPYFSIPRPTKLPFPFLYFLNIKLQHSVAICSHNAEFSILPCCKLSPDQQRNLEIKEQTVALIPVSPELQWYN